MIQRFLLVALGAALLFAVPVAIVAVPLVRVQASDQSDIDLPLSEEAVKEHGA